MDRRNFLKTGGIALLGSLATGSAMALTTPGALGGEGADKKAAVALAMNHFGVSEADLKKVLAAALEKGGDYADLFFEHTISNSIRLMDGAVNNSYSNIDYGVGVRVLIGDQSGYAYPRRALPPRMRSGIAFGDAPVTPPAPPRRGSHRGSTCRSAAAGNTKRSARSHRST